jgi:hypothetical protein
LDERSNLQRPQRHTDVLLAHDRIICLHTDVLLAHSGSKLAIQYNLGQLL